MKSLGVVVFMGGGIISLFVTLKYLPTGILFMMSLPVFPVFGLYAGVTFSDWIPSLFFFGSWLISTILFILAGDETKNVS